MERGVENAIVPTRIHGSRHVHVAAVIGDDQAVGFHGLENSAHLRRISADILGCLESKARAQRRRAHRVAGFVRCGPHIAIGGAHRDAKGVRDGRGIDYFIVAHESGEHGQAGGVGGCPPFLAAVVRLEVKHGAARRFPARTRPSRTRQFIENPAVTIDEQHVTITAGIPARHCVLDVVGLGLGFLRNGITGRHSRGTLVALASVRGECHLRERLRAGYADVRNAVRRRRHVGMQLTPATDPRDVRSRFAIEGRFADIEIPPVAVGEHLLR